MKALHLFIIVATVAFAIQAGDYAGWQQAPKGHIWQCNVCGWRNLSVWTTWRKGEVIRREHEDMRPPRTGAKHYDIVAVKIAK